jgi:hypothetical protein
VQIYNEQLYDLLAPKPGSSEGLAIMEDTVQGTYVSGQRQQVPAMAPAVFQQPALLLTLVGSMTRI